MQLPSLSQLGNTIKKKALPTVMAGLSSHSVIKAAQPTINYFQPSLWVIGKGPEAEVFRQFSRACHELGNEM